MSECVHLKGWVEGEEGFMDWPECGLGDGAERLCAKDGDRARKSERDWTTCYRFWRARAEAAEERVAGLVTDANEWRDTARQFAEKLGWFWDAIEEKQEVIVPLRLLYLKAERTPEEEDKFQRLLSQFKKLPPISAEDEQHRKAQAELRQSMNEIKEMMKKREAAGNKAKGDSA